MKRLREESEDLLWRAEVVEEDVMRESVERADELEENKRFRFNTSLHFMLMLYFTGSKSRFH